MRWPHWYPTRSDILTILFVLVLVCFCAVILVRFPLFTQRTGFGPDWDCTVVPQGDPVCTKKLGR
jgi:hypothetical protein